MRSGSHAMRLLARTPRKNVVVRSPMVVLSTHTKSISVYQFFK